MPIPTMTNIIRINATRLQQELREQGCIGWREGLGLFREAYTESYEQARVYLQQKMVEAGLQTRVDAVGNLFGYLPGTDAEAPAILSGSHLDAVLEGGIYDGHYGIFAALEAARSLREQGIRLRHGLEVVAFTAEEAGPLGGTFGSRAFCGLVETAPPAPVLAERGLSLERITQAKGDLRHYRCYLEAHIEQGPVLWRRGLPLGIPTGIVGITRYQCTVRGEANHAGTTPMLERKDALYESVVLLHRWLAEMRQEPEMVCNVAELELEPGQIGVVNGRMDFLVEIRALKPQDTQRAVARLQELLAGLEACHGEACCTVAKPPAKLDESLISLLEATARDLGQEALLMPSGASHDASPLSKVMPTAMIFVPSVGGISHNKEEYTPPQDLAQGALLLANTILRLDRQ